MEMARMRVRGQRNAGFTLKDLPIRFLSIKLDNKSQDRKITEDERIDLFVTQYLLPLISSNGTKIDYIQAMKNMRNVNIMSYCDGTLVVQNIEKKLLDKMQELGYSDEECEKIQSQMCMFPIATDRLTGKQKSTCVSFKDINDLEVSDNVTPDESQKVPGHCSDFLNDEHIFLIPRNLGCPNARHCLCLPQSDNRQEKRKC